MGVMYVHVPEPERLFLTFPLPPLSRLSHQGSGFRRAFQHIGEMQRACRYFRYGPRPLRRRGSEAEGKKTGNTMSEELRISISNAMAIKPERGNSQRPAGQSLRYHSVI